MYFTHVLFRLLTEVSCLNYSPVNVLAPELSSLFFIDFMEMFTNKLRVDGCQLNQFEPKSEDLTVNETYILVEQTSDESRIPSFLLDSLQDRVSVALGLS